jgi:class 3 adenylate cyclase
MAGPDEGDGLGLACSGRRYVTVLFTDLSGYTGLCERLDPEDVTEIMGRVIGEIRGVARKYAGSIEKFVGDAALVVFGVPEAHEDDQVRAIKAALEIHGRVRALSARVEAQGGGPISMHSGINSGLVVTHGPESINEGMGVTGDTINLASRLSDIARPGEILVGPHTFRMAEGFFRFEALEPARVGGRAEPVRPYRVLSALEEPRKTRRLSGLRAEMVGRQPEMAALADALARLRSGEPAVIAVVGDAGTGKSRLVEEFKASLDLASVQWHEGHAYAYSQNIHYSPLVHLLGRSLGIDEEDSPEAVRAKLDAAVRSITDRADDIVPYLGGLFSLAYPEAEAIDPEVWKARLHDAVLALLSALGRRAPTVVCIEDLHWADPSSLELLRRCMSGLEFPALFLFTYRPTVELLHAGQSRGVGQKLQTIRLRDLSPAETRRMVGSLLGDGQVSEALGEFVQSRGEGNPFYIEEVVNSLIETESVVPDEGGWRLARSSGLSQTPPTIQELITARLDRLDPDAKLVVQEASVIGRTFLEPVLRAITASSVPLERSLDTLERLDLIRTKSRTPCREYVFKHALIQDAVYGGLLHRQRRELHDRVGAAVESFSQDRAADFVETLAFHYKQGLSEAKAVEYLVASGDRALKRFALEESHRYYKEAFELISASGARTEEDKNRLFDLLVAWALVYYYRAQFKEMTTLLGAHRTFAETLQDASRKGMFFAWLGFSCFWQGRTCATPTSTCTGRSRSARRRATSAWSDTPARS